MNTKWIICFATALFLTSCSIARLKRFEKCDVSFKSISDAQVAGMKLQNGEKMLKINMMDLLALSGKVFSGNGEASLNINLLIKNNDHKKAGLDKVAWSACVNESEIADGVFKKHIIVKPGEIQQVSVPLEVDLKEMLSGDNASAAQGLVTSFMKSGSVKGVKIKVRPYVKFLFFYVKVPKEFETTLDDVKIPR